MRSFLVPALAVGVLAAGVLYWYCWSGADPDRGVDPSVVRLDHGQGVPERVGVPIGGKIVKTDEEWRQQLTAEQYRVTRKKGTERAFTGEYANCHKDGIYHCVCCGQPLFDATTKFESGTGWPSYFQPIAPDNVTLTQDRGMFTTRTEVLCSRCDAHLGHVFEDGPAPTGLRYCMNSAALKLVERGAEPAEEK